LESVQNSQKNEESPSSGKNNPKQLVNRKRKCSGETADIREKRLIAQCEFVRKRKQMKVKCVFGFLGIYKDFLVFWGPQNNPLGVGGGGSKRTIQ